MTTRRQWDGGWTAQRTGTRSTSAATCAQTASTSPGPSSAKLTAPSPKPPSSRCRCSPLALAFPCREFHLVVPFYLRYCVFAFFWFSLFFFFFFGGGEEDPRQLQPSQTLLRARGTHVRAQTLQGFEKRTRGYLHQLVVQPVLPRFGLQMFEGTVRRAACVVDMGSLTPGTSHALRQRSLANVAGAGMMREQKAICFCFVLNPYFDCDFHPCVFLGITGRCWDVVDQSSKRCVVSACKRDELSRGVLAGYNAARQQREDEFSRHGGGPELGLAGWRVGRLGPAERGGSGPLPACCHLRPPAPLQPKRGMSFVRVASVFVSNFPSPSRKHLKGRFSSKQISPIRIHSFTMLMIQAQQCLSRTGICTRVKSRTTRRKELFISGLLYSGIMTGTSGSMRWQRWWLSARSQVVTSSFVLWHELVEDSFS